MRNIFFDLEKYFMLKPWNLEKDRPVLIMETPQMIEMEFPNIGRLRNTMLYIANQHSSVSPTIVTFTLSSFQNDVFLESN